MRIAFWLGLIIIGLIPTIVKREQKKQTPHMNDRKHEATSMSHEHGIKMEASSIPHKHETKMGVSSMPHKHETGHYTAMADASKLPEGYILLNGEPVRVADLDVK